ncbi:MAG TPA: GNAT family N-acetyltransferase [Opitutaceae bacterium]
MKPELWPTLIPPGSRVYVPSFAATPRALIDSLLSSAQSLTDIEFVHLSTPGGTPWASPGFAGVIRANSFLLGPEMAEAVNEGRADYTPASLSEIPALFRERIIQVDVALVHVSPPDADGMCSLGIGVDATAAALATATTAVAQINRLMPRVPGSVSVPFARFNAFLEADERLTEFRPPVVDSVAEKIGQYVAQLIENGATLRLGTAPVHAATARALANHKHLGIHTDVLGDPLLSLVEKGVVDNSKKSIHRGKTVASFCLGSRRLYEFASRESTVKLLPIDVVNNPMEIARNRRMVTVHSAFQVDLSGQVIADSVGHHFHKGIGSQMDFIRGAAMSEGGVPMIAMPSLSASGAESRIVTTFNDGAGIVTSRGDVHYVVTEFGIATLRGRSIRERALELVQVAHPRFRDRLLAVARLRNWVPGYEKMLGTAPEEHDEVRSERITLKGMPFRMRHLRQSDERRLQEFFYSHTQETIQTRYGYKINRMTRERAYELVNVDRRRDVALAIFEVQGPREVIHAVGRYYLSDDGRSAEVAFVTRESRRRFGMARCLLERLISTAVKRGLDSLTSIVRSDNEPMLGLFRSFGATFEPLSKSTSLLIVIPVPATPVARAKPRKRSKART